MFVTIEEGELLGGSRRTSQLSFRKTGAAGSEMRRANKRNLWRSERLCRSLFRAARAEVFGWIYFSRTERRGARVSNCVIKKDYSRCFLTEASSFFATVEKRSGLKALELLRVPNSSLTSPAYLLASSGEVATTA